MKKQFNYTRPALMYVGYVISSIIFLGTMGLILPENKPTVGVFFMSIGFLLLFLLIEFFHQKTQVTLTDKQIIIKNFSGSKSINYSDIYDVELDLFTSNLIIKSIKQGSKKKNYILNTRISRRDCMMIERELNREIDKVSKQSSNSSKIKLEEKSSSSSSPKTVLRQLPSKSEINTFVKTNLINKCNIPEYKIKNDSHFSNDLGLHIVDHTVLMMDIEKHFNCSIPDKLQERATTLEKTNFIVYKCIEIEEG